MASILQAEGNEKMTILKQMKKNVAFLYKGQISMDSRSNRFEDQTHQMHTFFEHLDKHSLDLIFTQISFALKRNLRFANCLPLQKQNTGRKTKRQKRIEFNEFA